MDHIKNLDTLLQGKQFEIKELFRKNGIVAEVNSQSVLNAIKQKDSAFYTKVIDILNGREGAKFENFDPTFTGPDPGYTADGTYVADINNGTGAGLFTFLNKLFGAANQASSTIASLRQSITGETSTADLQMQYMIEQQKAKETRTYLIIGAVLIMLIIAVLAFKK